MKSPEVIVRTKYLYSLSNPDRKFKNISKKYVNTMLDYYIDDKKRAVDLIDYYTRTGKYNKSNQVNLILENGEYASREEMNRRKEYIGKQIKNSNLWQIVVSFNNDYIDTHIKLSDLEQLMAKEIVPKFLKNIGFQNTKNIMYQMSLHTNTSNYHFHIAFIEKKPSYLNSKNELTYRRLGKISRNSINFLKNETLLSIEREHEFKKHIIEINKNIEDIKKYFKENSYNFLSKNHDKLILENQLTNLGDLLSLKSDSSKIKFNSIKNKEIVDLTKEVAKNLFKSDPELKGLKNDFDMALDKLNNYLQDLSSKNNIDNFDNSFVKKKEEYLNNYVYNAIINNYKKITFKDDLKKKYVSREQFLDYLILKNYKSFNKNQKVRNHLQHKYSNTDKISFAIKNINKDLERDIKDFEKLFYIDNDLHKEKSL